MFLNVAAVIACGYQRLWLPVGDELVLFLQSGGGRRGALDQPGVGVANRVRHETRQRVCIPHPHRARKRTAAQGLPRKAYLCSQLLTSLLGELGSEEGQLEQCKDHDAFDYEVVHGNAINLGLVGLPVNK